MFEGVPDNITYCTNNEEKMPRIMELLKNKNCSINDCSDNWNTKQKKIITEKNICVYDCSKDDLFFYEFKNKCYKTCPEGTHLSKVNNLCIIECPENLPYEKNEQCFTECNILDFFNKICKINYQSTEAKEYLINNISKEIINGSLNSLLSNSSDNEIKNLFVNNNNKEIYEIKYLDSQINDKYNNSTFINLGECEKILRNKYNINKNKSLLIFKVDYFIEDFMIPITEYEIFHPETKQKLNLNYCNNTNINIFIPVTIEEENLYKYNPDSEYYKNKCFPTNLECLSNNTIEDRKISFNNDYLSLCEANCIYKDYDLNNKKALCECRIKTEFNKLSEILNNKNKLLYLFEDLDSNIINDIISNIIDPETKLIENSIECLFI